MLEILVEKLIQIWGVFSIDGILPRCGFFCHPRALEAKAPGTSLVKLDHLGANSSSRFEVYGIYFDSSARKCTRVSIIDLCGEWTVLISSV